MSYSTSTAGKYTHVWQKYRPVLLNLMVSTSKGPQTYDLSSHEFIDVNNKRKTGYSFSLKMFQSRNVSDKKLNGAGTDLLAVLQQSQKAQLLTDDAIFKFDMDRHFKLQVSCEPVEKVETDTPAEVDEEA